MADINDFLPKGEVPKDEIVFPTVGGISDIDNPKPGVETALVEILKNGFVVTKEARIISNVEDEIELRILKEVFDAKNITDIGIEKIDRTFFHRGCMMYPEYRKATENVEETIGISIVEGQEDFYRVKVNEYYKKIDFEGTLRMIATNHMDEFISFGRGEFGQVSDEEHARNIAELLGMMTPEQQDIVEKWNLKKK